LQRFYGIDLLGLWRGELSPRRLAALVSNLPRDAAVHRATYGERARWGDTEHLLADVVDLLQLLWWAQTKDGSKNRNRPKPLPRPGVTPPKDERTERIGSGSWSLAEMRDKLDRWHGKKRKKRRHPRKRG
jgi:hypothetical protein